MTEDAVRIIPLGGLGEIGKNMTAIEYRGKIVVVDCGIEFPRDEMLGIDLILPDIRWLLSRQDDVLAFVITHGHEDHHGALPFVLKQLNRPVYGSRFTLALIKSKLDEHGLIKSVELHEVSEKSKLELGPFDLSFVAVSHSVPDALSVVLGTDLGAVVITGDYKFDHTPIDGRITDVNTFARLGEQGRAGAARRLHERREQGLDAVRGRRRPGVPPDLRRGRGPRDRRLLRLAPPPRAAGHPDRPPARAQVRRLRPLDDQERQHRPQPRHPQGAGRGDDQAHRDRRLPARGDPHPHHRQPGRAALGAHAHGVRRPPAGGAQRGRHGGHLRHADPRQRAQRGEHGQPAPQGRRHGHLRTARAAST